MTTPAAPVATTGEPTATAVSALDAAISSARERIATGETMVPGAEPVVPVVPETPAAPADPFATPPPEGEVPLVEGEEPPPVVEGAEPPPVNEELLVALPGRRPGELDLEIEVSDPLVAERLRQMRNGYARAEEARGMRREAEQALGELEEVQSSIAVDPIAFVAQHVRPEFQMELALAILTSEGMFEQAREILDAISTDNDKLATLRADLARRRYEFKEHAQQVITQERGMKRNARDIRAAVDRIMPAALKGDQAAIFREDCLRAVADYADSYGATMVDPSHLPMILAKRLQAFGIDPMLAAARLAQREPSATSGAPRRSPAAPAAPATGTVRAPTGAAFVQAAAARRAVASIAPAGAGAPAGSVAAPPKGSGIKEAIEHARTTGVFRR